MKDGREFWEVPPNTQEWKDHVHFKTTLTSWCGLWHHFIFSI
jgi:hypothetical protein